MLTTLQAAGMNDAVELSFYPVGGFSNKEYNKTVSCASTGVDANCTGDIYEACILQQFCKGVACPSAEQLEVVDFLHCFETINRANMSFADGCAKSAGLEVSKIHECFDDSAAAKAAFDMVLDAATDTLPTTKCFPWVKLEGVLLSTDPDEGCLGKDAGTYPLLDTLCNATGPADVHAPAACENVTSVVV